MIRTDSGPISKSQIKIRREKKIYSTDTPILIITEWNVFWFNSKNVWSSDDDDCHYVIEDETEKENKYWHMEWIFASSIPNNTYSTNLFDQTNVIKNEFSLFFIHIRRCDMNGMAENKNVRYLTIEMVFN